MVEAAADDVADRVAVVAVATPSHLHRARSLFESVARHLPEARRRLVVVARDTRHCTTGDPFEASALGDSSFPDLEAFARRHRVSELAFAAKPWAMAQVLAEGATRVLYLDTDIVAHAPLQPLVRALDGADIALTPHRVRPRPRSLHDELVVLQAGTFNSGFVGVRAGTAGSAFLDWWKAKLAESCVVDVARGLAGDQRYLDLVPGLFDGVQVVREPGWNVGPWNLDERRVERDGDGYRVVCVDDEGVERATPLVFFHYSGVDPAFERGTHRTSRASPSAAIVPAFAPNAALRELCDGYRSRLDAMGRAECAPLAYDFMAPIDGLALRAGRAVLRSLRRALHRTTSAEWRRRLRTGG